MLASVGTATLLGLRRSDALKASGSGVFAALAFP
jgi:hypothetical protein